jgi:hypothetical protein
MSSASHLVRLAQTVVKAEVAFDRLACDEDDISVLSNAGVAGSPDFGIAGAGRMNEERIASQCAIPVIRKELPDDLEFR